MLSKEDRAAATALTLQGEVTDGAAAPLSLLAGAASAMAAGDTTRSARLRARATAQSQRSPTYYGDAWVALGGALLDGSLTNC